MTTFVRHPTVFSFGAVAARRWQGNGLDSGQGSGLGIGLGILGVLPLLFSVSCTHVPVTEQGEDIEVLTLEQAAECERLGRTASSTRAKVWFFSRSEETVAKELRSLARNAAPKMGGTAIAPLGEPNEGEQEFGIYRCDGMPSAGDADAG